MKILFHDCDTDNSYVASTRTDCKDSVDASLWDMHEQYPSKVWTTGKTIASIYEGDDTLDVRGRVEKALTNAQSELFYHDYLYMTEERQDIKKVHREDCIKQQAIISVLENILAI